MMDASEKAKKHLHWTQIELAVLDVLFQNISREGTSKETCKASADSWAIHSSLRGEVFTRSRSLWMERTSKREIDFPYSEDFAVQLYMRFRKRGRDELDAYYKEISAESKLF